MRSNGSHRDVTRRAGVPGESWQAFAFTRTSRNCESKFRSQHIRTSISCDSFVKSAFLSRTYLSEPGQPEAYERTEIMAPSFDTLSDHDFQEDDVEDEIDFSDLREQYDVRMEEGLDTFCV